MTQIRAFGLRECGRHWGFGLYLLAACSAGAEPGSRAGSGSGGAPAVTSGGNNASSGGTKALPSASGGSTGISVTAAGSAGKGPGCNDLTVIPKPVTPTVLVLVDNSSSMFEPREQLWDLLFSTLMDQTVGVVAPLQDKVRFGFASFKGNPQPTAEDAAACTTIRSVPYALGNYEAIRKVYAELGSEWSPGTKWETPTGHALNVVTAGLVAYSPDPPGPKYILLVTDGNPNTCEVVDPQCGQDLSVKAVQDAKALGIGTFAVGIGDIVSKNSGCETRWGRCGKDHLQDLANAGQGLPVVAPPAEYVYQSCADKYGRVLKGTYAQPGETPGTAPYFTASNAAELKTALEGLLNSVVSCTFDMNARVTGNPSLGSVAVGTQALTYGDANGWRLEDNSYQVTLQGAACDRFKAGGTELNISFPCDVAVPR